MHADHPTSSAFRCPGRNSRLAVAGVCLHRHWISHLLFCPFRAPGRNVSAIDLDPPNFAVWVYGRNVSDGSARTGGVSNYAEFCGGTYFRREPALESKDRRGRERKIRSTVRQSQSVQPGSHWATFQNRPNLHGRATALGGLPQLVSLE